MKSRELRVPAATPAVVAVCALLVALPVQRALAKYDGIRVYESASECWARGGIWIEDEGTCGYNPLTGGGGGGSANYGDAANDPTTFSMTSDCLDLARSASQSVACDTTTWGPDGSVCHDHMAHESGADTSCTVETQLVSCLYADGTYIEESSDTTYCDRPQAGTTETAAAGRPQPGGVGTSPAAKPLASWVASVFRSWKSAGAHKAVRLSGDLLAEIDGLVKGRSAEARHAVRAATLEALSRDFAMPAQARGPAGRFIESVFAVRSGLGPAARSSKRPASPCRLTASPAQPKVSPSGPVVAVEVRGQDAAAVRTVHVLNGTWPMKNVGARLGPMSAQGGVVQVRAGAAAKTGRYSVQLVGPGLSCFIPVEVVGAGVPPAVRTPAPLQGKTIR